MRISAGVQTCALPISIWEKGAFEVERIHAIEAEVKHDVIAFLTNVAEHVGEPARFMHQGMPSHDVLDTDRKSVVYGKSVPARADTGGRRHTTKKQQQHRTHIDTSHNTRHHPAPP